jgi:hypothetical protein
MKRHAIALIVQPYKNRLMPKGALREAIDRFAEQLLQLGSDHPNFHFNVALPAYILECVNPLLLSRLRELVKKGSLEWLCEGYSEPFLSLFPMRLTEENIRHGSAVFAELTGAAPAGFLPPFSNWEPSAIPTLRRLGFDYAVLSSAAFPDRSRDICGYWFTDFAGDAVALFPSRLLHHYYAPADTTIWLESILSRDARGAPNEKFVALQYLLPLSPESGIDPYGWLKNTVAELDKNILLYQTVLLHEARSLQQPEGLQYLPPCLPHYALSDEREPHYFLNRLHSYDQFGILQRKLLDLFDKISLVKDQRQATALRQSLFAVQDINRFLPAKESGFTALPDRLWSFSRLIEGERKLRELDGATAGGRIEITDFLRNGDKSIIMTNGSVKAYIDFKNGGHLFELDFLDRSINLCATLNPASHFPPDILSPGKSYTAFIDRIYDEQASLDEIAAGTTVDTGNFSEGAFEYVVKKNPTGVKTVLTRQGSFQRGDKSCPLSIEKVFGIEKKRSTLSFVYQLGNGSLAATAFTFAAELTLSLPGSVDRAARVLCGSDIHNDLGWQRIVLDNVTKWSLDDPVAALRLQFTVQKPVRVLFLPVTLGGEPCDPSCGIRMALTAPVSLAASASWTLMGSVACRRLRDRKGPADAL